MPSSPPSGRQPGLSDDPLQEGRLVPRLLPQARRNGARQLPGFLFHATAYGKGWEPCRPTVPSRIGKKSPSWDRRLTKAVLHAAAWGDRKQARKSPGRPPDQSFTLNPQAMCHSVLSLYKCFAPLVACSQSSTLIAWINARPASTRRGGKKADRARGLTTPSQRKNVSSSRQ